MPVKVYYNNQQITGEPYVSRSLTPMDYGDRWGMTEAITLNGVISGVHEVGSVKTTGLAIHITDIFKQNFKSLQVYDDGVLLPHFDFASVQVEDISFDKDKWGIGAPVKYTVKLKAYDVFHTDTVTEPEDSYAFTEGEDGSVSVIHKISAKGIKSGNYSPLHRAITFVNKHVGVNHYGVCDPIFMSNKEPVLLSKTESVNRLEGTYSVTENYKYNSDATGLQPYLKTHKLSQNQSTTEDFHTVDYDIEYTTDDVHGIDSLRTVVNNETAAGARTYEKHIASELLGSSSMEDKVYQVSINLQEDEDANKITLKATYQTGMVDLSDGYFDYKVDFGKDEVTSQSTYSINGDFQTFGSVGSRSKALKVFKDTYYDTIESYLAGKITSSQVFKSFGNDACANCDGGGWQTDANNPSEFTTEAGCKIFYQCSQRVINPYPQTIKWSENPNKATLNISAEFSDADYIAEIANAKYNVSVTSPKHLIKEIPSANVDGVYVLQDLNCISAGNTKVAINGEVPHGIYVNTDGFPGTNNASADMVAHDRLRVLAVDVGNVAVPNDPLKYSNGHFNKEPMDLSDDASFPYTFSISEGWLHSPTLDNMTILYPLDLKVHFGHNTNYTRAPGFKFGY